MKFPILIVLFSSLALVGCSNTSPVRPESASTSSAPSAGLTVLTSEPVRNAAHSPNTGVGFNGDASGFPTGKVFLSGGGAFDLSGFAKLGGGFSCLETVSQGPLSVSINPDDPGPCLAGQGIRWDTAQLLTSTMFKCTAAESTRPATTGVNQAGGHQVVLQADFYRAGNGNNESFTAQMIVSDTDLDDQIPGIQTLWVQGVGAAKRTSTSATRAVTAGGRRQSATS
jgi:hypothetical protein